jgi:hypothetical protein
LKLVEFSNSLDYEELSNTNKDFIIDFASKWPSKYFAFKLLEFLNNNTLIINLIKLKKKFRIQEKKLLIEILTDKLMLQSNLMNSFFDGLFIMKDKEQLSEYMAAFINSASYLGYTDFNVKKLLTALRLLHPDPKKLDENLILNTLVLLSMSDVYYKTMEKKQVAYIEQMLDLLEERFSGKRVAHIEMPDSNSSVVSKTGKVLLLNL